MTMREHWTLPADEFLRYTGPDWLLHAIDISEPALGARLILLHWRACSLAKEAPDDKGKLALVPEFRREKAETDSHGWKSWIPTEEGWVKVNVDGAYVEGTGEAAIGIIARDHHGSVLLSAWKTLQMIGSAVEGKKTMDLNQFPSEVDFDFLDAVNTSPSYCTQVPLVDASLEGDEHNGIDNPSNADATTQNAHGCPLNNQESTVVTEEVVEDIWLTPPVPYTGQAFSTKQEAREFYNSYAKRIGFSVCTSTTRLSRVTREQNKVQFVCNKEGRQRKTKEEQPVAETDDSNFDEDSDPNDCDEGAEKKKKLDGGKKRKREKMIHTDCKAKMVVKLIASKWHVINFVPDHNHDLVLKTSLKKFLRSHKGIPKEEKDFIALLHGSNLRTGRIMQLMNKFYGSAQLVPYEGKDVSNFRSTIRKAEKYKDVQETLDYFKELEDQDAEFFYKIKLDEDNRVECLFWVDGAARRAYIELYNDLVSFDATYMTNMYDMPFAPFIGINKHGQSFMLGCGFIRDEKTPSYVWLFETFLEAMQGKAHVSIITDQDGAMRCAIAQTFPNTNHRNCRWHIMDKFTGTIGPILDKDEKLEDDFKECMNYTVSPDEFEVKWSAMISKYNLQENVHFQHLYAIRSSFVPAYYMHCFYPFLQSTQRSEGFNAVLKKYVNPNMSILHFVRQYQKIQDKCLVAQDGQDFRTDDKERRRWSRYPIEKHALTVFTKNLFYRFSKEFEKTAEYDVTPEGQFQYLLVPNNNFVYGYGKRTYLVTAVVEEESYYCDDPITIYGDFDGASAMTTGVGNPPRSKVKGRKKEKRFKKGMNAGSKRKNKCSLCRSTNHNAAKCPTKEGECVVLGSVAVE
ncbi:protein FAR1-RELATED SEQUENCE 5-like [Panicum virgatum]|uniref:protein FAR1-RELATED SEQUENCE 5-like n=1 Tax=Panicum virgatum TaxID=38727 RepID=UPI0019D5454A|nr:protein FAR1-RELATED SEQUENCE 5-like [Panicum virgatum]